MKHPVILLSLAALPLLISVGCQNTLSSSAAADALASGQVEVSFDNPDEFSDFKDSFAGTPRGREDLEYQLRRTISEEAARVLEKGQRLSITFTDIDLAGDFLPTVGRGHDIRVVKSIYPPRMEFRYRLTDAAGNVVREGERKLRDNGFELRSSINRNEGLHHDKEMLRDWFRKEFGQR